MCDLGYLHVWMYLDIHMYAKPKRNISPILPLLSTPYHNLFPFPLPDPTPIIILFVSFCPSVV